MFEVYCVEFVQCGGAVCVWCVCVRACARRALVSVSASMFVCVSMSLGVCHSVTESARAAVRARVSVSASMFMSVSMSLCVTV